MPYRLTNDLKDLLSWLVNNFPKGNLKSRLFEGSTRILDFNDRIPDVFNFSNLADLNKAELIIFRPESRTVTALQGRAVGRVALWEIQVLTAGRELVINNFKETGKTACSQPVPDMPMAKLKELRDKIDRYFDVEGLEDLFYPYDYENIPGSTKRAKIRGIIEFFRKRNEMTIFISILKQLRPRVEWPQFEG